MNTATIIVEVTTTTAHGAEQDCETGVWFTRGSRCGQWVDEKIHSIHDHPKKARQTLARLTSVEHTQLADPSDPQSPADISRKTDYCIRELRAGMDWPSGSAR